MKYALWFIAMFAALEGFALPDQTGLLNEPYLEWTLEWDGAEGKPHDVEAAAVFTHESGEVRYESLMFYAGGTAWKFRFTGTRTGEWRLETRGPGALGSQSATVTVLDNPEPRKGFFGTEGTKWIWLGSGAHTVPQFAMAPPPGSFWRDGRPDAAAIDTLIDEFIHGHGFNGFHFSGIAGAWFDISKRDTRGGDGNPMGPRNPDGRTFRVLEEFLLRNYRAGAAAHLWMWGADGHARGGPEGIGGPMSETDRRILRYIAARLGPLPGWSMGYGYDLHAWADADELQTWYGFLKDRLGGWPHPLGARADRYDANNAQMLRSGEEPLRRRPHTEVYWSGDYVGHYDYRPAYAWYAEIHGYLNKPQFQEDRFRIRSHRIFRHKDYTPAMTVRGLWHSAMAGGTANIWGNLLPEGGNAQGSLPYSNRAAGEIQGKTFTVDIKDPIRTYHEFWFGKRRFSYDLHLANDLTGGREGDVFLSPEDGNPIEVCLRHPDGERFVFYAEQTRSLRMDLRGMKGRQPAVAVDTGRAYEEIPLGALEPMLHEPVDLPRESNWAVAVGEFPR